MFGHNTKVGKREFANDPPGTLRVSTVLPFTLQGEGPLSGQPSIFVRLAHCNMDCSFCDTAFERGEVYTYDEVDLLIQRRILNWFGASIPEWARWTDEHARQINLVITGGEPTLQNNLHEFIAYQQDSWARADPRFTVPVTPQFKRVQIESNGILRWLGDDDRVMVVVSPKAFERDHTPLHYIHPHPTMLDRADALKFVVQHPRPVMLHQPVSPYWTVPDWALEWSQHTGRPVYVSPMNEYTTQPDLMARSTGTLEARSAAERTSFWEPGLLDMAANQRNHEHAAALCMRTGARLSLQTHLLASLP